MTDDLDHDAADELLRKVDRRDSQDEDQHTTNRPPLSLPPMDLSFRRKKRNESENEGGGDAAATVENSDDGDSDKAPSTTFGPAAAWSRADTVADTEPPVGGGEPLDKPRTGMGDFDVVMERDGIVEMLRKRPAILLGAIPVVAAVVAVTAVVLSLGGSDETLETLPDPEPATAASIQTHTPGTYVAPDPGSGQDDPPGTSLEVWGEPEWKSSPEKLFTWYGDGLSEIAATFHPIIGTSDFRYFWKVDNATSTDQAIRQIQQAVTAETIGDVVVFAYGNNEDVTAVQMDELREAVGDRGLILVGTGASDPRALPWSPQLNGRYQKLAAERPNTYYVDWQSRVTANPNLVERGFVLTPEGTREWVAMINSTVLQAYR